MNSNTLPLCYCHHNSAQLSRTTMCSSKLALVIPSLIILIFWGILIFNIGLPETSNEPPRWEQCERLKCSLQSDCNLTSSNNCCADKLFEMMMDIHSVLKSIDPKHFLMYGSLLGATRDKDIIPWDTDVDIVISSEAYNHWPNWKSALANAGYVIFEDNILRICRALNTTHTSQYDPPWENNSWFPYVDVYEIITRGQISSISDDASIYLTKWLLPPSTCTIRTKTFPCAAQPHHVLRQAYGVTWKTPNDRYHSYRQL